MATRRRFIKSLPAAGAAFAVAGHIVLDVGGKTRWVVFDALVSAETARAAWQLFQEHVGDRASGCPGAKCLRRPVPYR
jgi:hypothetical protein